MFKVTYSMLHIGDIDVQILVSVLLGVVVVISSSIIYFARKQVEESLGGDQELGSTEGAAEEQKTDGEKKASKQRRNDQWKSKIKDVSYDHAWSVTTLKGHTSEVTGVDFAQDGKKFVSVSADRSAFFWDVRNFEEKEHKCVSQVLDFDTATKVSFSPDNKSMVFAMKRMNKLAIFKLMKKEVSGTYKFVHVENVSFPAVHTHDISHCGISSTGKFLMSASHDMKIVLYDIHGNILKVLEPKLSSLFDVCLSPDGRFVAACGFTPDAFVYEVLFNRDGSFQDVKRAFDLKGHNSGVFAVALNSDSSRAVTISRDGYWRVFDTDIRYAQGQEAVIVNKGDWSMLKGACADHVRLAVSPSGGSFAITCGSNLKVFSSEDGLKDFPMLPNIHGDHSVHVIRFSPCGRLIATCGDRYIRIFRNVPEYHSELVRLNKSLNFVTGDAPRRRIREQIEESKKILKMYCI